MCVTDRHDMTSAVKVELNPNTSMHQKKIRTRWFRSRISLVNQYLVTYLIAKASNFVLILSNINCLKITHDRFQPIKLEWIAFRWQKLKVDQRRVYRKIRLQICAVCSYYTLSAKQINGHERKVNVVNFRFFLPNGPDSISAYPISSHKNFTFTDVPFSHTNVILPHKYSPTRH